jgi:hypothetical protein
VIWQSIPSFSSPRIGTEGNEGNEGQTSSQNGYRPGVSGTDLRRLRYLLLNLSGVFWPPPNWNRRERRERRTDQQPKRHGPGVSATDLRYLRWLLLNLSGVFWPPNWNRRERRERRTNELSERREPGLLDPELRCLRYLLLNLSGAFDSPELEQKITKGTKDRPAAKTGMNLVFRPPTFVTFVTFC